MNDGWQGRPVVVTGGLGFIGSNLAVRLVEEGARVTVIDLPDPACSGRLENIAPIVNHIAIIRADLAGSGAWCEAIQRSEIVFHLAAQVSHSASMSDPAADLRQNCAGLLNVLEAMRSASARPKLVFTSTRQVYGRAESLPVRETHPIRPPDINGVHKAAAEEYLRIYRDVHGVRSLVLRLANTYGPRMDLVNPGRGVLNVFLSRALRDEPIVVFGDGSQRRDLNHVDDVVEALLRAALIDHSGPFHLGAPAPTSLNEFLSVLGSLHPVEVSHQPFPAELKAIDIGDSHCDFSRFQEATGWLPRTSLEVGLQATLSWFRARISQRVEKSGRDAMR